MPKAWVSCTSWAAMLATLIAVLTLSTTAQRTTYLLDHDWKFEYHEQGPPQQCPNTTTWPYNLNNVQCFGLSQYAAATDLQSCLNACCADPMCETYQVRGCPECGEDGVEVG